MSTRSKIAAMVLIVAMAGSVLLSYQLEQKRKEATLEEVMWITSPKMARYLSLGYTGLASDVYWTRAVQYFGAKHQRHSMQYRLLPPLLNLTTELDPQLMIAYYFGSFFLSQQPPEGAGDPDAAVRLVEKGIQKNPDEWRLWYHLGLIHYMARGDYKAAADAFEQAAKNPNALEWVRVMAAVMRQKSGSPEMAAYIWNEIYQNSQNNQIRENAAKHLVALRVDADVNALKQRISTYQQKHGTAPTSWRDLIADGLLAGVPVDPTGCPYVLHSGGRVEVARPDELPFITQGLPPGYRQAGPAIP
jgi:tetratricopeptide (TPR) repeat protein